MAIWAILSLVTSFRNPLNSFAPFGREHSAVGETQKSISLQRIEAIGQGIEKYTVVNGHLPTKLQELVPFYISASFLTDPWGNTYKYLPRPERYLVIGFSPDGKADTDLFLSRAIDTGPATPTPAKTDTGGIELIE
jgi:hypothetical protein